MNMVIPPIKCQGIKTKLVPQIRFLSGKRKYSRWIEPFVGSGVVAFNILPDNAILCDTNPYIIDFYLKLKSKTITAEMVKHFLRYEGEQLSLNGEKYYYYVRDRFNEMHSPLDFLFLNRSCFNGIIRFNSNGKFNVPFCRKVNRFSTTYITKITNQIAAVSKILEVKKIDFFCQDFKRTFAMVTDQDFVYCDPPYIGRHTDYYNQWNEQDELALMGHLTHISASFILSTWKGNDFRENKYIPMYSQIFHLVTQEHFYHVGGTLENRHMMEEALFMNFLPESQYESRGDVVSQLNFDFLEST